MATRSSRSDYFEYKRARGEASCAECRRLKQKCDRKIPCSNCIRRGCDPICPVGTTQPRKEASPIRDGDLRSKLLQMSKRIRQLEDALHILQSRVSTSPHPLLSLELLEIKKIARPNESAEQIALSEHEACGNFGSLTILDKGITHFLGRSGNKTMFSASSENAQDVEREALFKLPPEIAYLAGTFPFSPACFAKEQVLTLLENRLPSYERATALIEAYDQHIAFFSCPVERQQILEELIPKFYKRSAALRIEKDNSEIREHQLALLFAVFACGAVGDLTLQPCNEEGETYRQLARTALGLQSVFEGTSLATVQAVAALAVYDFNSARSQTAESAFKLYSLALCLGITIGLHWDPESWNSELNFVQRRRRLFWELYEMDIYKSISSGRPVMLGMDEIDCKIPEDSEVNSVQSYPLWRIVYAQKVTTLIARKMSVARPIKYSEILELDRHVRDFSAHACPLPTSDSPTSSSSIKRLMEVLQIEAAIFFIHRNFFILTLRERPKDPLRSRFSSSFLATYASAISILRAIQSEFDSSKYIFLRRWPLWVLALGCAVAIGSIAATGIIPDMTQSALQELELAIELFQKVKSHPVPKNGLPILLRLRDTTRSKLALGGGNNCLPSQMSAEEVDEALSVIGETSRSVREAPRRNETTSPLPAPSSASIQAGSSIIPPITMVHNNVMDMGIRPEIASPAGLLLGSTSSRMGLGEPSMFTTDNNAQQFSEPNAGDAFCRETRFYSGDRTESTLGDVDVMIEDVWHTIFQDPRFTTTGMFEPTYNF